MDVGGSAIRIAASSARLRYEARPFQGAQGQPAFHRGEEGRCSQVEGLYSRGFLLPSGRHPSYNFQGSPDQGSQGQGAYDQEGAQDP